MISRVTGKELPLLGGRLCLDFVNTIDPRLKAPREEFLPTNRKLLEWAEFVGLLTASKARSISRWADNQPAAAAALHGRAIRLREALYCLFVTRPGEQRCLDIVNREFRRYAMAIRLQSDADAYSIRSPAGSEILGPIVQSAYDLLISPQLSRVRQCEGDGCGWLFVDTSRTHRRRWCSMAICGNRAKASRHRQGTRRLKSFGR